MRIIGIVVRYTNNMEEFRSVPNYEGRYQVSNLGRVKSIKNGKEIILKQRRDKRGYILHQLQMKTYRAHQLVAMAFLDHTPTKGVVVDHINNIKDDNCVDNLRVISHRANCKTHARGKSKCAGVNWDKNSRKWKSSIQVGNIREYLGLFVNEEEASEAYKKRLNTI